MYFRGSTDAAGTFLSRNIESIISRLDISINGVQIQTIDQYNRVFNIIENLTGSKDYRDKRSFVSNANPIAANVDFAAAAAQKRFVINNWLGFLNS